MITVMEIWKFFGVVRVLGLLLCTAGYPIPDTGAVVTCTSFQCLNESMTLIKQMYNEDEMLVVGFVSINFGNDAYLPLYLGYTVDQFDDMPMFKEVFYVLYQCRTGILDGAIT